MATLSASPGRRPSNSPSRRRSFLRRCERNCCNCIAYFPLVFVYGLTTWALWVQSSLGLVKRSPAGEWEPVRAAIRGRWVALLGVLLWLMLNWCYTTAVFTDPGSPSNTSATATAYTALPDQENYAQTTNLTVKSTGEMRFCKKCQTRKPDRAHHCSTCRRCVLKMDHHCPWLATCVGLRNYKTFLLFLIYTCLFCYVCFFLSASWIMLEMFDSAAFENAVMPVHYILLAVLSGIIGLVLTGFTGWHMYLTVTGQTTIESLEKTRYLTPIRKSMQQRLRQQQIESRRNPAGAESEGPTLQSIGDQLREIHANALPGVTRPEEGEEERASPAQSSLRRSYRDMEQQREVDRYNEYLDEKDSDKLPNAFDLGWKRNMTHVFGEKKYLWGFPIINTTGDGWQWEASADWIAARDELAREREAQRRGNSMFERDEREFIEHRASPSPRVGGGAASAVPLRSMNQQSSSSSSSSDRAAHDRAHDTGAGNVSRISEQAGEAGEDDEGDSHVDERTPFTQSMRANTLSPPPPPMGTPRGFKSRPQTQAAGKPGMSDMDNWNDLPDDILSSGASPLRTPKQSRAGGAVGGAGGRKRSSPGPPQQ